MDEKELWAAIGKINAALQAAIPPDDKVRAGETGVLSIDSYGGYVGFEPQALIDLVNEHVGPASWRYEELEETVIVEAATGRGEEPAPGRRDNVSVEFKGLLYLRVDGEWITKGSQVGGARAERNLTDGKKSARTDFIKKALGAWSIGAAAYRGDLQKYLGPASHRAERGGRPAGPRRDGSAPTAGAIDPASFKTVGDLLNAAIKHWPEKKLTQAAILKAIGVDSVMQIDDRVDAWRKLELALATVAAPATAGNGSAPPVPDVAGQPPALPLKEGSACAECGEVLVEQDGQLYCTGCGVAVGAS